VRLDIQEEKMYRSPALVYHAPGDVRREELEIQCGPEDLVLRVDLCARCGTDRTIFMKGHPRVDRNAPVVLGHEFVGRVVEVGKRVRELREGLGYRQGRRLAAEYLDFQAGEKVVIQSRAARYSRDLMLMTDPLANLSFEINGAYSQYMKVTPTLIRTGSAIRVPEGVSDAAAALAEPAACALESIFSSAHPVGVDEDGRHRFRSGLLAGGRCCIIGSGAVAATYARLARLEGVSQLVMLVRSEAKARLLRGLLDDEVQLVVVEPYSDLPLADKLAAEAGIAERMCEFTGGELFDDVVAACSDPDAQRLMLALYAPRGGAVGACFGGTHQHVDHADIDAHHYRLAKTVGSSGCSTRTLETVVRWLGEGRLNLDGLLDPGFYSLDDDPAEFLGSTGQGLKPALAPWKRGSHG
jgi:L-iditol 2-dehydrogenase